ncbi:Gfo/Idh/MocA family protein [Rhizobium ruizarguesonis]|uniref:Gfo/Idh/MocA family protein n=1 Tax=Rhizobium TaxID=379 RepID=UPI0013C132BC|nr:Gfo/Idh/MocA family oxidoreductase [Rhizobium ruizarguesonis]NEI96493.1 gfo/Idh/MocA family oxidoreductase [Rhizobium ruizarguesonis]NEJ33884.1 gfo/Idh/MocA family oxidoreductase [Rhizobium ruizarguesonis]
MTSINIGFIGAGPVTQAIHLPAIATLAGQFRTTRVMDVNPVVAEEVARRYGAVPSTDAEAVLSDPSVEVVAICSPNAFHAEQVIRACRAGKKAVLCEKPLAVSMTEAKDIRAAAAASGTAIFVGTMHAYDPAYRAGLAAWRATGDVAFQVRNAIFLPSNDVFVDQATELVKPEVVEYPSREPIRPTHAALMRGAMLGLAIHDLPLVRDFQPEAGRLAWAHFLPPFGYAIVTATEACTTELTAVVPGLWPSKWTFEAIGGTHRLHADMPPSYVMAGSATVSLHGPEGTTVFHYPKNGYQVLWEEIGLSVRDGAPASIPLDTAIEDLAFALTLADGAEALLENAV